MQLIGRIIILPFILLGITLGYILGWIVNIFAAIFGLFFAKNAPSEEGGKIPDSYFQTDYLKSEEGTFL